MCRKLIKEIAVSCLVGESDAGIVQGLILALGQTIEPQVERAAEELDTIVIAHGRSYKVFR